jgi:hypothetical protein
MVKETCCEVVTKGDLNKDDVNKEDFLTNQLKQKTWYRGETGFSTRENNTADV